MRLLTAAFLTLAMSWSSSGQTYTISTFAGGGVPVNIPATSAGLDPIYFVTADRAGNVFFVDQGSVLRLDATTGVLTLAAGIGTPGFSGDNGPATSSQLNSPCGVAVDSAGNLYIAPASVPLITTVGDAVLLPSSCGPALGAAKAFDHGRNGCTQRISALQPGP
jgi:DNA-binding beta-propeller fold protein YncE